MEPHTPTVAEIVAKANRTSIAARIQMSLSGVSRILSGKRNARSGNLAEIAMVLGVPMGELYTYLNSLKPKRRPRSRKSKVAA